MFDELKTRGCQDILTEVVDSLKELTEAIGTIYPKTALQICGFASCILSVTALNTQAGSGRHHTPVILR